MTTKAIRAKAKKFDLSSVSRGLVSAINAVSLDDAASTPSANAAALAHIAVQCGATAEDVHEISAVTTLEP